MKATGIVRRVDDLGRVVIPKEIRRTLRIREGDPLLTSLTVRQRFACAVGILESRTFSYINQGTYSVFRRNPNILRRVSRNATPVHSWKIYSDTICKKINVVFACQLCL